MNTVSDARIERDIIDEFQEHGVTVLRGVFCDWIETLQRGVEHNIADPGPYTKGYTPKGGSGRFFGDYCNWQRIPEYKDFVCHSGAGAIAGQLMQSHEARFFHEHVLVKEPGTAEATPWHHDQPYWTVDGSQVCSLWIPLDPVARETCVEFVAGSHRWGKWYTPKRFGDLADHDTNEGETLPDIDTHREDYEILAWDLEPGDCIAFHALVVHGAPGNPSKVNRRRAVSLRLTGDDARFARRDGYMSPPFPDVTLRPGDAMDCDSFPVVWPRGSGPGL